jgi:agmatine deiminase
MSALPQHRMPAEWEPHAATWIAWPHNPEDWPGKFQPIPWVYTEIVRHLSRVEDVHVLVNNQPAEQRASTMLRRNGANLARCHFHQWPTDRVWLRDSGPIFTRDASDNLSITNWSFNAWAKYDNFRRDNQIPQHVALHYNMPERRPTIGDHRLVLEGGSIDVNGKGVLLTTEECLLSEVQQRNPGISRQQLEQAFAEHLGIAQTLWLNRGCAGDDTHGHIDDIARFVPGDDAQGNTILACVEPNTADENHLPLAENLERLRSARNLAGQPFEIRTLPMPAPVLFEGQRLPASYANFYIANSLVLVPTFNDPNDRLALNVLADCFPDRAVVGIHAVDLVWGLGTLHCLTQQEPAE